MGQVFRPTFISGPPKKISATYDLGLGEAYYGSFGYDVTAATGFPLDHDPSTKTVSAEYDWESGHYYQITVTFAYNAQNGDNAP